MMRELSLFGRNFLYAYLRHFSQCFQNHCKIEILFGVGHFLYAFFLPEALNELLEIDLFSIMQYSLNSGV